MKKLYHLPAFGFFESTSLKKHILTGLLFILSIPACFSQSTYCIPAPESVDGLGITNVTIGSINNTTVDEPDNYGDYTAQVVNVGQTVSRTFSITLSTGYDYGTKIWIDWNNDFDFNDAGEEVFSEMSSSENPTTLTGAFTVPANAILGNHRLRVGGLYGGDPTPCYSGAYATFEDYTLNVTTPPSCITPTNATGTSVIAGTATLAWTAPSGTAPAGYEYIVSTSNIIPTGSGTATTARTATATIENNTDYYLHVRSNCGNNDFSEWITSNRFRYTVGDVCATAINLQTLVSPYTSSTVGANTDFTTECTTNAAPDVFYYIQVPVGYVLDIQQTESSYDSLHTLFYGNCNTNTILECNGYGNSGTVWENTTGSTQTVYWVQYGYFGSNGTFTLQWSLIAPPACNIPREVAGTMTSLTTANISWAVPVTGNPTGYEYAVTTSIDPPASGTLTTSLAINGISTVANAYNYVHVRTNCGTDGYSEWVTYTFYSGHCIPASLYLNYYNIVSFNTTNGSANISNNVEQYAAYANNFDTMAVSQLPGNTFDYAVAVDDYTNIKIWVDWNNDLDFDDPGEEVAANNYRGVNETYTGTITVPPTITPGNYRMRVRSTDNSGTTPCGTNDYGTAQDYAITVGNPPTCIAPTGASGTATASGTARLSWSSQVSGNTSAQYEYAVTTSVAHPATGTAITGTAVENYTGLTDNTYYYLHVRTSCGNGDYSQWIISRAFKYLAGDTCESAINLATLTSPYTGTTEGADDNYTPNCELFGYAPDLYYYIDVPNGYTYVGNLTGSEYNSVYSIYYGNCGSETPIACLQSGGFPLSWENTTRSSQRVYWVQDGGNNSAGSFTFTWQLLPPPPCDKPLDLVATLTSVTTATVSWGLPNTGTPAGYEYAVTQNATPPASGTYTTVRTIAVNNVVANTNNYLHVRSACGEEDGNSEWVSLAFYSGYCVPVNTDTAYYITGISTTGAQTNFTIAESNFSAYTDYTGQYAVTSYPGGSFNVQATAPVATDAYLYSIWVDWNNNFDFTDAGERVLTSTPLTSPASLGSVTIPAQTPLGLYRMRVRNLHTGSPVSSCGEGTGEAEDYILNVVAAPACSPPFNLSISPTDTGFANLNWNAPQLGGSPVGYEYVFGTSATEPTGSGTPTTSFFQGDIAYNPAQSVYLFVRTNCGNGEYSTWATMAVLGTESPEITPNSVIIYKENSAINITSGTTLMTGVTIYDTRGRKLYRQADINTTQTTITGLQIQQQVVIVEVETAKGKVSKKIVF